jgi:catechol 2,3-dioxygenase-like lactoylglutathione lyase family enzyme
MAGTDLPLVMIWRRSTDLASAKASADGMLSLKLIGEEEDKLMYDAGSVILAFWGMEESEEQFAIASEKIAAGGGLVAVAGGAGVGQRLPHSSRFLAIANQCGGMNLSKVPLVTNPALNMRFVMENVAAGPGATLSAEGNGVAPRAANDEMGKSLPFYDDDGNLFSVTEPGDQVTASADLEAALGQIRKARADGAAHLSVTSLLVSDVVAAAEFYREILGFKQISGDDGVAVFDVGNSVLRLQNEQTPRTVRSLFRSGRLNGDWLVFHTPDIKKRVKLLSGQGVTFPLGVEASATGKLAFFTDRDGISLVLWEPPKENSLPKGYINFFPVLNRLLEAAG